jgi:hypothetical protein
MEVLKPLFEKSLRGEISRQDVLAEILPEKMMAWKPAEAFQETEQLGLQQGFVARIDSSTWNLATQESRVLDVTDRILHDQP